MLRYESAGDLFAMAIIISTVNQDPARIEVKQSAFQPY